MRGILYDCVILQLQLDNLFSSKSQEYKLQIKKNKFLKVFLYQNLE